MNKKEYELFIREKALSWVRKEIRKYRRSLYLINHDPKTYAYRGTITECEEGIARWRSVEKVIKDEIDLLIND